jgi:hypothetical protein
MKVYVITGLKISERLILTQVTDTLDLAINQAIEMARHDLFLDDKDIIEEPQFWFDCWYVADTADASVSIFHQEVITDPVVMKSNDSSLDISNLFEVASQNKDIMTQTVEQAIAYAKQYGVDDLFLPEYISNLKEWKEAFQEAQKDSELKVFVHPDIDVSPTDPVPIADPFVQQVSLDDPMTSSLPAGWNDDPMTSSLPAGWNMNGQPILISDLVQDPKNVMPYDSLSNEQIFGLVIARIAKRPNYHFTPSANTLFYSDYNGMLDQHQALVELKKKSDIGYQIVDAESLLLKELLEMICDN